MMNILLCAKVKGHPQRHSKAAKVSKNDVITRLCNITVINNTLIKKNGYRTICPFINVNINAFITKILKFSLVLCRYLFAVQSVSNRRF